MSKVHIKIFVFALSVACAICFVVGLSACNNTHTHNYSKNWSYDEINHWHAATCEHSGEKSGLAAHADNNDDGKCDTCDYEITHRHTFNESYWLWDSESHWRIATCEHTEEKGSLGAHVDENNDNKCDICDYPISIHEHSYSESWDSDETEHWRSSTCEHKGLKSNVGAHVDINEDEHCDVCFRELPHVDTFSEDWTFDEANHWHVATCRHKELTSGNAAHSFVGGVCECGVKQSEVDVYAIYAEHTSRAYSFVDWLTGLEEAGVVEVRVTEAGDAVYEYENGSMEAIYVAERTVKVEAITEEGQGVANVWIMVSYYLGDSVQEVNGGLALALAETDADGIANITFVPVGGYSDDIVNYRIRVAEAKDIAAYKGIDEEDARPIPNRYHKADVCIDFADYLVGESVGVDGVSATFTFEFSRGWNAYEKFTLPYARYYEKPLEAEGLNEEGFTFEFTTSGDNLFDYFYFTPANKYSFESASSTTPPDQLLIIEQNFAFAASGFYTISFVVEGKATATLYYWNEGGVNLGAYHNTNPDGTPAAEYVTSLSGGTAGNGYYTGGNFVNVAIEPANGLRMYQLGLRTDTACKVTVIVERTGDYVENSDYELNWADGDGRKLSLDGVQVKAYDTTTFALKGIPEGLYTINLNNDNPNTGLPRSKDVEKLTVYTNTDSNRVSMWEGTLPTASMTNPTSLYKCIIRVATTTNMLYIVSDLAGDSGVLTIEKYDLPTLTAEQSVYLPVTTTTVQGYEISLDSSLSGEYNISIIVCGINNANTGIPLTVKVGNNEFTLTATNIEYINKFVYSGKIRIENGDTTISFITGALQSYTGNVTLSPVS